MRTVKEVLEKWEQIKADMERLDNMFDNEEITKDGYDKSHKTLSTMQNMLEWVLGITSLTDAQTEAVEESTEEDTTIEGIIFRHGADDYGLWEGFYLSKEEESAIWHILQNHDTEGCSVRGTRKEIAEEMVG